MITDSSKDYLTGRILINFTGDIPSYEDVNEYCHNNYGFRPNFDYTVDPENDFMGYTNPGTVTVETRS